MVEVLLQMWAPVASTVAFQAAVQTVWAHRDAIKQRLLEAVTLSCSPHKHSCGRLSEMCRRQLLVVVVNPAQRPSQSAEQMSPNQKP